MCRIVDQLAIEKGIDTEDANFIFNNVVQLLVKKIPSFTQVIEDVFEEASDDQLKDHLDKMIATLQNELWREKFKEFLTYQHPQR